MPFLRWWVASSESNRNSQMLDEDDILNETPKSSLTNMPNESAGTIQQERNLEIAETQTTTANSASSLGECRNFSEQRSNPIQRKRILPAWMLVGSLSERNLSAPAISGDNDVIQESGKKAVYKDKTPRNKTQQGRKRFVSAGNSESTSLEEDTKKKCRNADQEESPVISTKEMQSLSPEKLSNSEEDHMKTDTQSNKIPTDKFGQISEHTVSEGMPDKEDRATNCSKRSLSTQDKTEGSHPESSSDPSSPETSHSKAADSDPQGSEENKVKRTSCMYGANCYRKNPVHFQHFSHPGDNDYGSLQVMDQEEADDRPECPYGASCYRKNPQHKIEYRHDVLPMKSISDEDNDNVGQSNEYDLNDSFIDDEEEEYEPTDEDSDWEPGKEDQEKEDVEELLKEAKKFMRRKK
ncbi:aprataxin and PNK-like factor isoform X2 [Sorex araneus]|uniref:aprataxin and PNK-like factor isoform X2 n=1 Tax=Sorex araneus TaxID=42254 RepID=UPI00243403A1|nr:aprataxin and PNK-like factor isoform X2 [Sorex araneus]